jgi:hypothetical protein
MMMNNLFGETKMAKEIDNQQPQQQMQNLPSRQETPRFVFRTGWIWTLITLLGISYLLKHIQPVLKWNDLMDSLHVHDRQRYTSLGILCLVIIFIVAAAKIIGTKEK